MIIKVIKTELTCLPKNKIKSIRKLAYEIKTSHYFFSSCTGAFYATALTGRAVLHKQRKTTADSYFKTSSTKEDCSMKILIH